ncbi:ABC transporter permease [Psychroflexus sediminis]|uniref:Putative ABC transport system permease protein n=1 Tax=Psychroflexus sediminis TaxID=470826 RepID=A0A1G7YUX0_9FLAO|nr:ABC transporter permease [Psychroflexus sediminis]SDH00234.1 putative ABC transport system permease protein [Psychroflexus sediminis]
MFNRDKWNEVIESLTSNLFRTILTAFGVFWGIFILVILLAAGNGFETGVKQLFDGISSNSMFMWSQTVSKSYNGLPKGRRYSFDLDDVEEIKRGVSGLKYVSPRNQLGGFGGENNVVRGLKSGAFNVYGDYPDIQYQEPMKILKGRFLNQNDIEAKRKVAVIGEGVVKGLYDFDEDPIGTYVKVQGVNFMVIGIYKKKGFGGGNAEEAQKQIYVPFTAYSQAFNMGQNVGWMAITANDNNSITRLKPQIFDIIKENHDIAPDDDRAIGNFDLFEQFSKISGLFIALNAVAYFVGILILLSGVIGISNIMLIVVKERTNEIGVRRALGATPWQIRGQILFESVFLTIIAGMTGIVFATGVLAIINALMPENSDIPFTNPSVDLITVIIALLILIVSGLFAGFIPAQNAIRVKPVDALRTE